MARQPLNIAGVDQIWQTVLFDDDGKPILEVSDSEYVVNGPNGEVTIKRLNSSIQLMCNSQWHPGPDAEPLGVCELCRKPPYKFPFRDKPKHGLVSLKYARRCSRCYSRLLCPKHVRIIDRRFYCPSCALICRLKRLFIFLLFRDKE